MCVITAAVYIQLQLMKRWQPPPILADKRAWMQAPWPGTAHSKSDFFRYPSFSSPHLRSFSIHKISNTITPPLIIFKEWGHSLILFFSGCSIPGFVHTSTVWCDNVLCLQWVAWKQRGELRLSVLPFHCIKSFHLQAKQEEDYNIASACLSVFNLRRYEYVCMFVGFSI